MTRRAVAYALVGLTCTASAFSVFSGAVPVGAADIAAALGWPTADADPLAVRVLLDLRLPRLLAGLLVGASLAAAGVSMQGLFRNPLADPGLVGVSSGAALAAVAAIVIVDASALPRSMDRILVPVAAFFGGLCAALLATRVSQQAGHTRIATLLLAGLAINAIAGAGIGLLTQMAGDTALREAVFWLFGSLAKTGWAELVVAAPLLLTALAMLARDTRALDALSLGEAEAGHLGVHVESLKRRQTLLIVLCVAVCVALAGIIGFIGLVVPHLLRLALGPGHRTLLPAAALAGASLLALADVAARIWMAPTELPVGVLTALLGGPFFLGLLIRLRGRLETW